MHVLFNHGLHTLDGNLCKVLIIIILNAIQKV